MRRSPIVIAGTLAGVVGVLSFHTAPAKLTLGTIGTTSSPVSTTSSPPSTTSSPPSTTSPPTTTPSPTTTKAPSSHSTTTTGATTTTTTRTTTTTVAPTTATTAPATTARSATGPVVNYNFGVLSVTVTVAGTKITKVAIGTLNDGGNFRSQSIDQQAIPQLEQQAMTAQSASIQGVSGASYTSAGFKLSLQDALTSLGFK